MTITDIIVLAGTLFAGIQGLRKGFMRTILGPASLILGMVISYGYYLTTKNAVASLLIGIFGPIALNIALSLLLNIWHSVVDKDQPISLLSQVAGVFLSVVWTDCLLIMSLMLVLIIPPNLFKLDRAQNDIRQSVIYAFALPYINRFSLPKTIAPSINPQNFVVVPLTDPAVTSSPEFKEMVNDEKFQTIINDPTVTELIKKKDYAKLLTNPKFIALCQDEELMKKILALYPKLFQPKDKPAGPQDEPYQFEPKQEK